MNEIMVGVIDSGIDIYNYEFYESINGKKVSLIDAFYYQQEERIYEKDELDELLNGEGYKNFDPSGHGTAVAGIVLEGLKGIRYRLVVAGLSKSENLADSDTGAILKAMRFITLRAQKEGLPLVVNLSYGNSYGDHSGNSILENYIDAAILSQRMNVVTGMGNLANLKRHTQIMLINKTRAVVEINVGEYQTDFTLQIWRSNIDILDIWLILPDNTAAGSVISLTAPLSYSYRETGVTAVDGISPFSSYRETFVGFFADEVYVNPGIWRFVIIPKSIQNGRVDMWLSGDGTNASNVNFLNFAADTTLTIPASSEKIISVGAYDRRTLTYASFSGRGYTVSGRVKPDVLAPGVDVDVVLPQNVKAKASGTSFAAPYATAAAARLMYDGIVLGGDIYMYGERLKSELIKQSKPLPGYTDYPNEKIGWGVL